MGGCLGLRPQPPPFCTKLGGGEVADAWGAVQAFDTSTWPLWPMARFLVSSVSAHIFLRETTELHKRHETIISSQNFFNRITYMHLASKQNLSSEGPLMHLSSLVTSRFHYQPRKVPFLHSSMNLANQLRGLVDSTLHTFFASNFAAFEKGKVKAHVYHGFRLDETFGSSLPHKVLPILITPGWLVISPPPPWCEVCFFFFFFCLFVFLLIYSCYLHDDRGR